MTKEKKIKKIDSIKKDKIKREKYVDKNQNKLIKSETKTLKAKLKENEVKSRLEYHKKMIDKLTKKKE